MEAFSSLDLPHRLFPYEKEVATARIENDNNWLV